MLLLILAAFVAGFVDAIVGGGGMISLPSLLAMGLPPNIALGSNKLIGISTAVAGSSKYIHSKTVKWDGMVFAIPAAFFLSALGAYFTTMLSVEDLRHFIFYALISVAIFLMYHRNIGSREKKAKIAASSFWIVAAIIGFYDGFFGPGTGTFLIIGLIQLLGYTLLQASATARIINLTSNVGAVVTFVSLGLVDFKFVFPGMIAAFVGGLLGATYSVKYGNKGIRPILFIVVFALILKLGIGIFTS